MVRPDGMDGIGWFSYEIVKRWIENHPEHEFILLTDRRATKEMFSGKNVEVKVLLPPARKLFLIHWWNSAAKRYVNRKWPDIFVCLDGQFSDGINVPVLNVIHDLNFHHHPEWLTPKLAHFYNSTIPSCAKSATRLATVSEYSKQDLVETYGIAPQKIDVVYNGFNESLLAVQNEPVSNPPYFFFIGIQVPRKNIEGLVRAFSIFKEKYGTNHVLKLAGHPYLWNDEMTSALEVSKFKSDIQLLGRKEFGSIQDLYSGAEALLYIPHFEGFGIPILEGFAAGVPVICSNTTSLPEVAGDATLSFSPRDYEGIADAMFKVSSETSLRNELIEKGTVRLKKFGWKNTSEALWNSLLKTLEDAS